MNDHLAAPVREFLALYAEKYAEVRFPGLDVATLENAAQDVEQAAAKVADAQAAVEQLREQARGVEAELTQKVVRALSFLKVYVEGDEAEYARLDALTLALLTRPRARKPVEGGAAPSGERTRRGRKPKNAASSEPEVAESAPSIEEMAEADLPSSALTTLDCVAE